MYDVVRYSDKDFEFVFREILDLEKRLEYWESNNQNTNLIIKTNFVYDKYTDEWWGELEVKNAKRNK